MNEVLIVGAAIVDILLQPVDASVFQRNSVAARQTAMTTGGDAMNEAIVLSRLGHPPAVATLLGRDDTAAYILEKMRAHGITPLISTRDGIHTSFNVVLVEPNGERHFITDPAGSMRRLALRDLEDLEQTPQWRQAKVFSLASVFVSTDLGPEDTAALLKRAKDAGKRVCMDTTVPKHGETARDIADALRETDYFFPNRTEAEALTGLSDPRDAARALLDEGVGCVLLKTGSQGCLAATQKEIVRVPAWPDTRVTDSTGAGDTFAAAFISGLLEGLTPVQCAAKANAAASICAEHLGATSADIDPLELQVRAKHILARCEG